MLDVLRLDQYTVVDTVELVCGPGLNVLTGETGAGKSIIVDALGLLLGARGSGAVVRPGAAQAEIEAVFDLADSPRARDALAAHDLPAEEQLVLRRVLTAAGKSRAYVNGRLVPLATMAALREGLCDFHGQHEHQSLLRTPYQLDLLDAAAGLDDARAGVAAAAARLERAAAELERLREQQRSKAQRTELLQDDLERLSAVPREPGAEADWRRERDRLAHTEELRQAAAEAVGALAEPPDETVPASGLVAHAVRALRPAAAIDPSLAPHIDQLLAARELVDDVARAVQRYADGLESDPAALEAHEQRLHALDRLKRRYALDAVEDLIAFRDHTAAELAQLASTEHDLAEAERARDAVRAEATTAAVGLSAERTRAAARLGTRLTAEIRELGMPHGTLEFAVSQLASDDGPVEADGQRFRLRSTGIDRVAIQFTANAGLPPRPLREVASGGELSRIMLALRAAQAGTIPLLVFDEIDAGIGGNVSVAVAAKLAALAATRQVFCVTHLPQIAARAATHWRVEKRTARGATLAAVCEVRGDDRAREVARMFGDEAAPASALEHAQALLSRPS